MRLWVVWNENKYLYLHTDKKKNAVWTERILISKEKIL